MKLYVTEIQAICPIRNEMIKWCGPEVPGISFADAEAYCQRNGLGYCKVAGELIAEIPCKPNSYEADFTKQINYDNLN